MVSGLLLATAYWATIAGILPNPLPQVQERIRVAYRLQERPVVFMQVDDTLIDTRVRTKRFIEEFSQQKLQQRTDITKTLQNLPLTSIHENLPATLRSLGIREEALLLEATAFEFALLRKPPKASDFVPTPGVVSFVRDLYSRGARLVYYTPQEVALLPTFITLLQNNGFPIGIFGTELVMRPSVQIDQGVFKQQLINYLRHYSRVMAVFSGNSTDTRIFRRAFPEATCVFYNVFANTEVQPLGVEQISSFESL